MSVCDVIRCGDDVVQCGDGMVKCGDGMVKCGDGMEKNSNVILECGEGRHCLLVSCGESGDDCVQCLLIVCCIC